MTKIYPNGTVALKHVDLEINDGEFVFVTGHSGAGKSSLIHLLLCEDVPTHGDLYVNEINTKSLSHRQIPKYRRKLGVVFQDFRLIPNLNVYDNIAFAMRVVGRNGREIRRRVNNVLEIVGLKHKAKVMPDQLSGGEQQRVALARAIVNNPKIVIADEPTGNIDPAMSMEIMQLLNAIHKKGITVVVVTHESSLVDAFHKRIVKLENGRISEDTSWGTEAHPAEEEEAAYEH